MGGYEEGGGENEESAIHVSLLGGTAAEIASTRYRMYIYWYCIFTMYLHMYSTCTCVVVKYI